MDYRGNEHILFYVDWSELVGASWSWVKMTGYLQ